jgi:hypothetical protein
MSRGGIKSIPLDIAIIISYIAIFIALIVLGDYAVSVNGL